jgi:hypothetical protein
MRRAGLSIVGLLLACACAADPPGPAGADPAITCQMASEHVATCIDEYCAEYPTDVLCAAANAAAPLAECTTAEQADRVGYFVDSSCDEVVVALHASGGAADGNCPWGLQWICDLLGVGGGDEPREGCCVNCQNEPGTPDDAARCATCFTTYGRDSDDDGVEDRVIALYCVGAAYCNGCIDSDCDGVCDPVEP